jgi:hypothetical protein
MDRLQFLTSAVGLYVNGAIEYDEYCKQLQRVIDVRQTSEQKDTPYRSALQPTDSGEAK